MSNPFLNAEKSCNNDAHFPAETLNSRVAKFTIVASNLSTPPGYVANVYLFLKLTPVHGFSRSLLGCLFVRLFGCLFVWMRNSKAGNIRFVVLSIDTINLLEEMLFFRALEKYKWVAVMFVQIYTISFTGNCGYEFENI